jgi:hypothetical protein
MRTLPQASSPRSISSLPKSRVASSVGRMSISGGLTGCGGGAASTTSAVKSSSLSAI